jgi:hypothetical protein
VPVAAHTAPPNRSDLHKPVLLPHCCGGSGVFSLDQGCKVGHYARRAAQVASDAVSVELNGYPMKIDSHGADRDGTPYLAHVVGNPVAASTMPWPPDGMNSMFRQCCREGHYVPITCAQLNSVVPLACCPRGGRRRSARLAAILMILAL